MVQRLIDEHRRQAIAKGDDVPFEDKMKKLVETRIMTNNIKTNELLI